MAAVEDATGALAAAGEDIAGSAARSAFFARNLSLASRSSASIAARASASRCSASDKEATLPLVCTPGTAVGGDEGGACTGALTLSRRGEAIGFMAPSREDTSAVMLDMMEPEDDGGFSSCAAAGWGFEDVDPALSDDAGLVGRLCPAVWALILGRRGEDMGFMALSKVETKELMLDKNPPSEELPLSFFFKRASAFACCFSAAAASLATCRRMNKRTVDM